MLVRFLSYLGKEGFGEQFYGEYEIDGETEPCTIRWAAEPRGGLGKDNPLARVRDSGLLMQLYPDPIVPRVLAVVPCWNGLAVVSEAPGGIKLAEIEQRPLPEPVILEIVRQLSGMLDRVYTRKDANTGEMLRTMHRAISTECVHLRADGTLRITGFEKMSTVWSARAAETSALATHPGARLAPEQMAGEVFHATDVYLAGVLAVDLLVNPERASQTARMLAMCICDPEGFEEIREQILSDDSVEASTNLRGLLRAMLQEDPKSRPSAHIITNMAAAVGASEQALREFAASLEPQPAPEGLFHQFAGRTLELPDPDLRPFATESDDRPAPEEDIEEVTDVGALDDGQPEPAAAAPRPAAVTPPPPPAVASITPASAPPAELAPAADPQPEPDSAQANGQAAEPAADARPEPDSAQAIKQAAAPADDARPEPDSAQAMEQAAAPADDALPEPEPAPEDEEAGGGEETGGATDHFPPSTSEAVEDRPGALDPELGGPMPQPIKPSSTPLPVDQPLAAKAAEPVEEPAPFEPPAPRDDSDLAPPKKKGKLLLIIGIVAVLMFLGVIACGGGFALFLFL